MLSLRQTFVYWLLLSVKALSRLLYRHDWRWVGDELEEDPWAHHYRLIAILNHTSLYEFLFVGNVPNRLLRLIAVHGLVPVADKTLRRPLVGLFFRLIANNVVPVSRARDETWHRLLDAIEPKSIVIILPEGRMKRATGLDSDGRPMTVRSGVADLIEELGEGRMLLAYSLGLHHVQTPGQRLPKLFKTISLRLEGLDIADYRQRLAAPGQGSSFPRAVVADLTARRDRHCVGPSTDAN